MMLSLIHIYIGGGTTNISVFVNGSCVETCCLNIGGRLVPVSYTHIGAVASDGISEKVINLEIASKLNYILRAYGLNTVMTRTDDE